MRGHDPGRVGLELGEAHEVMRGLQLRLGGVDLRLRGLQRLLAPGRNWARVVQPCFEQRVLALEVIARLGQLPLGGRELGLRGAQRVHLVLRFEARHHCPGSTRSPSLRSFSMIRPAMRKPSATSSSRFDAAGERFRHARFRSRNRHRANRARLGRASLDFRGTSARSDAAPITSSAIPGGNLVALA